jgi:hypothetical protein
MSKPRDILEEKAKQAGSLKNAIEEDNSAVKSNQDSKGVETIINEEGKKIIVFNDPLYSKEKRSTINFSVFRGKWEFEDIDDIDDDPEKCAVRFIPVKDSSSLTIGFKSLKDRVEFFDSIYSDNPMKQTGTGMSLEKIANSKVMKTTSGIVGLSVIGYGLYKLFKGKEEQE